MPATTAKLSLYKGEGKRLLWYFRDEHDNPVDLTGCVFSLGAKRSVEDQNYLFFYQDKDFDHSRAAEGIVSVYLLPSDTLVAPVGERSDIVLQLKTVFPDQREVDKSDLCHLILLPTVIGT